MSQKITNDAGEEIEVFTAAEVTEQVTKATEDTKKIANDEFGKTKAQIEAERDEAKKALGERTSEFGKFRKLNDETLAKLSIAERTIYENQKVADDREQIRVKKEQEDQAARVDVALRSKAGKDEKLFTKMKELWGAIQIDAVTPEQIENKTLMVLGAIQTTQPDLLASVSGFSSGRYVPPGTSSGDKKDSFADTERGKAAAKELGLDFEPKKK